MLKSSEAEAIKSLMHALITDSEALAEARLRGSSLDIEVAGQMLEFTKMKCEKLINSLTIVRSERTNDSVVIIRKDAP